MDLSSEGNAVANFSFPHLRLEVGSAYDDLNAVYGRFPVVIRLEVVEHIYAPGDYAQTPFDLVEPGGIAIISTPYHSCLEDLALAVTCKMDSHFITLWGHVHIKFWSIESLTTLLVETGFGHIQFLRAERIPQLAKSMISIA